MCEEPLKIGDSADLDGRGGGYEEPWTAEKCVHSLASQNRFQSACNMFWLKAMYSPSPGVPYNVRGVQELTAKEFKALLAL